MAKTLLQLVQSILTSLDGEEINSINDTEESRQIVDFIRGSYEYIRSRIDLPTQKTLFELTPSNDPTLPTVMYLPATFQNMEWLKYDKTTATNPVGFQDVWYQELDEFLSIQFNQNYTQTYMGTSILTLPSGTFPLYYRNDKPPDTYTVIDNNILLFDSYDSSVDTTLVSNKTTAFGEKVTQFLPLDSFVPALSDKEFVLLENEAKNQAFAEQKQTQNPISVERARRSWVSQQREKIAVPTYANNKLKSTTNYGRRGSYGIRQYLRNGQ